MYAILLLSLAPFMGLTSSQDTGGDTGGDQGGVVIDPAIWTGGGIEAPTQPQPEVDIECSPLTTDSTDPGPHAQPAGNADEDHQPRLR